MTIKHCNKGACPTSTDLTTTTHLTNRDLQQTQPFIETQWLVTQQLLTHKARATAQLTKGALKLTDPKPFVVECTTERTKVSAANDDNFCVNSTVNNMEVA